MAVCARSARNPITDLAISSFLSWVMPMLGCPRPEKAPKLSHSAPALDATKLDAFYVKYKSKEPGDDDIDADGIERLCEDLGISALDPVTLVIAYHCRARHMGVFTREEFVRGMEKLRCDDLKKLQGKLGECRAMLADKKGCKEVYGFTFHFSLDEGQRCLPVDVCLELWKLLLPPHFALLEAWLSFVEEHAKCNIPQDTWMMLYDLATQLKPDLSDFDVDGSWPVLLDDFVESVRANKPAAGGS